MKLKKLTISSPRIEMLPLIDIVFLLLVFFIYAMLSMAVHHGQMVDLPESSSAPLEMQDAVHVTIKDVGEGIQLAIAGEPVALDHLEERLQQLKKDSEIQIFADKSVSYQELFQVMDQIKEAGLTKISLQAVAGK